ncbi:MAG TPA: alkaline phosphatase family protein [Kofleriaceae bacterium]|jgi:phospholipase C|nr:alkaline phosphatase family protein [Kofleriaceae bacterium]
MKQRPTRRRFLQGAAAAAGGALLLRGQRSDAGLLDLLPLPELSGIQHIVVVMMENRSFDHLLGWLPGANGRQAGLSYPDASGVMHPTFALAPTIGYQGCNNLDPDHSWEGGRVQYDNGAMDGWLRAHSDLFSIGYYERADRPFFNELAASFTTLDRYHCSILAETFPNRFFAHAAQTPTLHSVGTTTAITDPQTIPTIWDRLAAAGVSGRYYFSDVPFLGLWGERYLPISRPYAAFLAEAATGLLPAVSFVDPRFIDEGSGSSGDDHPHADLRVGDAFLSQTFAAVAHGPCWPNTVFIVTYDEWGGFFDHVAPPTSVAANAVDPPDAGGNVLLGMRVPVVVASPWTRAGGQPRISSALYDHTSILKLIEWRWNLPNLTPRDAPGSNITNLAAALDFTHPNPAVPPLPLLVTPVLDACAPVLPAVDDQWQRLVSSPLLAGWHLPL